jgi:uncharacterized protein (TIGR02145 family)
VKKGAVSEDDPSYVVILEANNWLDHSDLELWHGDKAQGPCPPGWKVPTRAEFNAMIAVFGTKNTITDDRRFYTMGDNSVDILYFTVAGYYGVNATTVGQLGGGSDNNGALWTADGFGVNQMSFFNLTNAALGQIPANSAGIRPVWALPVRCIQQ